MDAMATIAGTLGVLHQSVQPPAGDTLADLFGIYDALALLDTPAGCCKHGCRRRFALFNLSTELVTRAACLSGGQVMRARRAASR